MRSLRLYSDWPNAPFEIVIVDKCPSVSNVKEVPLGCFSMIKTRCRIADEPHVNGERWYLPNRVREVMEQSQPKREEWFGLFSGSEQPKLTNKIIAFLYEKYKTT